tara:strand:+ start:2149 stop:2334 length:186 start_codon:yes stop_codon:yes gene_type:complete
MKIRVNTSNSKIVDGQLFINLIKIDSLHQKQKDNVNTMSSIVHPILGRMVSYEGEFIRINK